MSAWLKENPDGTFTAHESQCGMDEVEYVRVEKKQFPPVLDACCGGKMMWFDRKDPRCLFVDKRCEEWTESRGKYVWHANVTPDKQADFTNLPFPSDTFALVVFDPPHVKHLTESGDLVKRYGRLFGDWREMLTKGFAECFRVLRPEGTLIFKWNEIQIPVRDVLALTPEKPLFGHKSGKRSQTHWIAFLKPNE